MRRLDGRRHATLGQAPLPHREPLGDAVRVDGGLVDVEQGHVVVDDLVQQDDELDQVGIGLLPERFLAATEQVVEQRGDAIGQRVGLEVVVERVVAVRGVEADLEVVVAAPVQRHQLAQFVAEVALHLEDEAADLQGGIRRAVAEQLVRIGIHAPAGLAGPDGAYDGHAGEEPALGQGQPAGCRGGDRLGRVVDFAEHEEEVATRPRRRIGGQPARAAPRLDADGEHVGQGADHRQEDEGRGERDGRVGGRHRSVEPGRSPVNDRQGRGVPGEGVEPQQDGSQDRAGRSREQGPSVHDGAKDVGHGRSLDDGGRRGLAVA